MPGLTEVSLLYADPIAPWYQSATSRKGFLWLEINGAVVAGSQTVATATNPAATGNTLTDLKNWVSSVMTTLTGVAASAYAYPVALGATGWGIATVASGNQYHERPFVALAYTDDFTFGALNVPVKTFNGPSRIWKFKITGRGLASTVSPGYAAINAYNVGEGHMPILGVLELNPE